MNLQDEVPWASHRAWTEETVRNEIAARFPELGGTEIRYYDEGFDYQVFRVDGRWAFKFPKRDDYSRQLAAERDLLDVVHVACPLPVPHYDYLAEMESGDVFGGYRLLPGIPALETDQSVPLAPGSAALLAAFVSHVHGLDPALAGEHGTPSFEVELSDNWRRQLAEEFEEIAGALNPDLADRTRAAVAELAVAGPHSQIEPTLNHGDLSADHILLDPETGRIVGVIDWSDAHIGDPAYDFGGILAWQGEDFAKRVVALCTRDYDPGLIERARAYALNYIVGTLEYGRADEREVSWNAGLVWLARFVQDLASSA